MKKKIFITIMFLGVGLLGFPQLKKANYLYDHLKYDDAIEYYLGAVNSKNYEDRYEAMEKLAMCYVFTNDVSNSIYWLTRLVELPNVDPKLELILGKQLMRDEQYDKAAQHFHVYNELIPNEEEGMAFEYFNANIHALPFDPIAEIKNVTILNSDHSDFSPIKFRGQVYFVSDREFDEGDVFGWTGAGHKQLYSTIDANRDDYFRFPVGEPKKIQEAYNQDLHSGPITFSKTGYTFFVTHTIKKRDFLKRENDHTIHLGLYYGDVKSGEKTKEIEFPHNNGFYNVGHASLSNNGKMVVFSSDDPKGRGHADLYMSTKTGDEWSMPQSLGDTINGFGNEVFPYLLNDTILYFASDSHHTYGGLDCFVSYKTSTGWSKPRNLGKPINSSYDDFGIFVNPEETQGYVCSDRPGGMGSDDIYAWKREKLIAPTNRILCGTVKNMLTLEPIEDAMVFVLSTSTRQVYVAETDSVGNFEVHNPEGELFIYHAVKKDYWEDVYSFRVSADATGRQCLDRDLLLEPGGLEKVILKKIIYYDLDKDFIRKDASLTLDSLIVEMKDERYDVALSSHTDIRASDAYNQDLSNRRALNAKRYLAKHGIDERRILMRGYGEKSPAIPGQTLTEPQHQLNRRTELKIVLHRENNIRFNFDYSMYENGDILPVEVFPVGFFGIQNLEVEE